MGGISSLWGGGAAKRAAKAQVAAIEKQTNLQTQNTNMQVSAMADMIRNAQAQRVATEYAEQLLSKPIETVDITLGDSDLDIATDNLLGRRRTTRQQYQRVNPTAPAIL